MKHQKPRSTNQDSTWLYSEVCTNTQRRDSLVKGIYRDALIARGLKTAPRSVLVIAPSWIGDAILAQPLLHRLKAIHPNIHIDVLAPPWCAAVWKRMAEIQQVINNPFRHGEIALRARWQLGRKLVGSYDQAIVLPNSFKAALIPWFAGIPQRTGYRGEHRYGLLNDIRPMPTADSILVKRYDWLGTALESTRNNQQTTLILQHFEKEPVLAPRLLPSSPETLMATLEKFSLSCAQPIVILCPGAEYGPAKRWPTSHFATLANKLIAKGFAVWLLGSTKDRECATEIQQQSPEVQNLCGETTLDEAFNLLEAATVVVCNDSGLMHAAAALGKPLIALFGSSSPLYTPPLAQPGKSAKVLRLDLPCSPCFARKCPLGHLRCLQDLQPEAVYAAIQNMRAE